MRYAPIAMLTCALAACGVENSEPETSNPAPQDAFSDLGYTNDKADMVRRAHILDDVDLDSTINGKFERRIRVYGFTFEAKAGAEVKVDITTRAGSDSFDVSPGESLDTVAAIYGPIRGDDKGPRLAFSEDPVDDQGGRSFAADLGELEIAQDGRYLVVFSSWDDPGAGNYQMDVNCNGTNFQCLRPVVDRPCLPGTRYIQGQTTIGTETWRVRPATPHTSVVPKTRRWAVSRGSSRRNQPLSRSGSGRAAGGG